MIGVSRTRSAPYFCSSPRVICKRSGNLSTNVGVRQLADLSCPVGRRHHAATSDSGARTLYAP